MLYIIFEKTKVHLERLFITRVFPKLHEAPWGLKFAPRRIKRHLCDHLHGIWHSQCQNYGILYILLGMGKQKMKIY